MSITDKPIDFMSVRKAAAVLSLLVVLGSVVSLALQGLNFGLDFTGGTLIEVGFREAVPLDQVRKDLASNNYPNAVVVNFGSERDVLIRLGAGYTDTVGEEVIAALRGGDRQVELRRVEFVGPQVGGELRDQGGLALLTALFFVLIYIAMRFQLKFGAGAVVALIHDVILTLGAFSLLQWDFDLTVLAALLAVIGYSLNDTIVVFDRVRENFRKIRKTIPVKIINISLTQTLSRTLVTSGTTLMVLLALLIFGGEQMAGFAQALILGVFVGTYSSIYVATNMLMLLKVSREDLMLPVREGAEVDSQP
jgi:preprotein translocase subunit SecF